MRFLTTLLMGLISVVASGYDVPAFVVEKFAERTLTPVEGAWLWNSGALVTIEADSKGAITLILADSADPTEQTPRVIGTGTFAGTPNTYKLELKADGSVADTSATHKTVSFIATVADNHLSLKPYSTGLKVNLWRMVPYLFRFSVSRQNEPAGTIGAIRVWPRIGTPELPVVL